MEWITVAVPIVESDFGVQFSLIGVVVGECVVFDVNENCVVGVCATNGTDSKLFTLDSSEALGAESIGHVGLGTATRLLRDAA